MREGFKEIPGLEGRYAVNQNGEILSLRWDRIRRVSPVNGGYLATRLMGADGAWKNMKVHIAVMLAFVGPREPGFEVDHINRIRTDNRLCNLRYCTVSTGRQNMAANRIGISGFRGVYRHADCNSKPWRAKAQIGYFQKWSKYFPTARQAARAYDNMVIEAFGEEALTNQKMGLL